MNKLSNESFYHEATRRFVIGGEAM